MPGPDQTLSHCKTFKQTICFTWVLLFSLSLPHLTFQGFVDMSLVPNLSNTHVSFNSSFPRSRAGDKGYRLSVQQEWEQGNERGREGEPTQGCITELTTAMGSWLLEHTGLSGDLMKYIWPSIHWFLWGMGWKRFGWQFNAIWGLKFSKQYSIFNIDQSWTDESADPWDLLSLWASQPELKL